MNNILNKLANFAENKIVKFLRITQIINLRISQNFIICYSNTSISQKLIKSCRDFFTVAHHNMVGNHNKQNVSCRDTSKYNPIPKMIPIYIENERGDNE